MIDVHVLTHEGTRQDWLDQCLESLRDQPCNIHVIDNAGNGVGIGRAAGFAAGDSELVAHVDSDDYVLPGCFDACLEGLQHNRAVVTLERVLYPDGSFFRFLKPMHNVAVYRREDVMPLIPKMAAAAHTTEFHMRRVLQPKQLSVVGYVWRCHAGGDHNRFDDMVRRGGGQCLQDW